jgi:hypothetical protein
MISFYYLLNYEYEIVSEINVFPTGKIFQKIIKRILAASGCPQGKRLYMLEAGMCLFR